jgi:hypothetical protein
MLALPAQKKQEDLNFKGHNGKKRNRSQYQTDVNIDAWLKNIERILSSSGIGEKCGKALRMFAQKPKALSLDFTPHQLAEAAGCNVKTIYRGIPVAVQTGLLVLVAAGNRGWHKAAVYRLSSAFQTRLGYQRENEIRVTSCDPPVVSKETIGSTPSPLPEAQSAPPPAGGEASEKQFSETEQTLALVMAEAGTRTETIRGAIRAARMENRIDQALKDAKAVLAYIKTAPKWMQSPGGLMAKAILEPERSRRLKRQARYDKTLSKRQSAKVPAPEPQKISLEMDLAQEWNFWRNEADNFTYEQRKTLQALENDRARYIQEALRISKESLWAA